ncbi:MAG: lysophospholipid acyltransferase family protein [Legionellales bacterium]|nr:lysophospholipid acyltransferase family protein [Legionellales bacterium]
MNIIFFIKPKFQRGLRVCERVLRFGFFQWLVRPIICLMLGLHIRHRERLPELGPAILIANHNSHLDTMVLMTLFPWRIKKQIRPVAAADYFLKNKILAWFAQAIIGIIPIHRKLSPSKKNPFAQIQEALDAKQLVIFFPEGSRGEPENLSELKRGITHLAKQNPEVPMYPIFLHGLGKALPKEDSLLVPFVIDVVVGEPLRWEGDADYLLEMIKMQFATLRKELVIQSW